MKNLWCILPTGAFCRRGWYWGGLLLAAALKAHGLTIDPLLQDSFLASPRLQILGIEMEILLGLWLLSGWARRAVWLAALSFFTLLSLVSLYLAFNGQQSCGCFGQVTVSPWVSFTIDVAAVAFLAISRPVTTSEEVVPPSFFLKTLGGAVVLLVLIGGGFFLSVENPADALAILRGEALTVTPSVTDFGEGQAGEKRTFTVELFNHTDQPIRVVGGTSSCRCITTKELPITIGPGETKAIEIMAGFKGSPGTFRHSFVLYTDNPNQKFVTAWFAGRVIQANSD